MAIDLETLREEARRLASVHAPRTRISYALDWRHFEKWCEAAGRDSLPATSETAILYLTDLLHSHRVATAQRRAAAIGYFHHQAELPSPVDDRVYAVLAGAQRLRCEQPEQKQPVTVAELHAMAAAASASSRVCRLRNRAILTLGFASALRRGSLAGLDLADITFVTGGVLIRVRNEKQDRKGVGRTVAVARGEHADTCAMRALEQWIEARGKKSGPLFTPTIGGVVQLRRVHPSTIARVVKEAVAAIGLDAALYAGHSLRAGFVTAAFERGLGEIVIAAHTGHRSLSSLRRYVRRSDPFRSNASGMVGL